MGEKEEYAKRFERITNAVCGRETDRVPVMLSVQNFPYYYAGCTIADAMDDYYKAGEALDKYYRDFHPDMGYGPDFMYYSKYMKTAGINWFKWAGEHLGENDGYQYIEGEYMKADEYEEATRDMTKFMMNKWIPRCFSNLKGLENIDFRNSMWFNHLGTFASFGTPEAKKALTTLMKAGEEILQWFGFLGEYNEKMINVHGMPNGAAGFAFAPFDMIGDTMRGTVEIMMDMFDRPQELLRLIDVITDFAIKDTIASCSGKSTPMVIFWLHKGVDDFMSDEQFRTFYWPSLRRYAQALVEAGLTPVLFCEGAYNNRLEYLAELPKNKCICSFEFTDIARAKKILGGKVCIKGNVPATTFAFGTPKDIEEQTKKIIDDCAPGGGFILDTGTLIDNAKTENVEKYFETAFTYGAK